MDTMVTAPGWKHATGCELKKTNHLFLATKSRCHFFQCLGSVQKLAQIFIWGNHGVRHFLKHWQFLIARTAMHTCTEPLMGVVARKISTSRCCWSVQGSCLSHILLANHHNQHQTSAKKITQRETTFISQNNELHSIHPFILKIFTHIIDMTPSPRSQRAAHHLRHLNLEFRPRTFAKFKPPVEIYLGNIVVEKRR